MDSPPLFSTFTLVTEVIITCLILYIFYAGYKQNVFHKKIVFFTLAYEIIFNISYMSYRALTHVHEREHSGFHIAVAAFHGIFSILMFILLIVFFVVAWKKYGQGKNFFKDHKVLTFGFIFLWMIAIFSGLGFYYLAYFTNT
ncbi:MAG TPA: hypothetical protein VLF20_04060 [Patescibacteria group bacterium]|nr:hypothetical protein [Patescibacteria group bacterium]